MNLAASIASPALAIDKRYACFRLRVGPSPIDRCGVFACEAIPPGRKVIEFSGERISRQEARRRFLRAWRRGRARAIYPACADLYWTIDPSRGGSGAERINHSCEPNLAPRRIHGRLLLFSRRRIRPGEELTFDYAFRKGEPLVTCRCNARTCRGTINRR